MSAKRALAILLDKRLLSTHQPNHMWDRVGRFAFWTMSCGFNITFFPMHLAGLRGMARHHSRRANKTRKMIGVVAGLEAELKRRRTKYVEPDWKRKCRKRKIKSAGWNGAQGRNRTTDTRIFSPLLYQLSYLGLARAGRPIRVSGGQARQSGRVIARN